MRRQTSLLLLLIMVTALACSKNDSPTPPVREEKGLFFTIKVDTSYGTLQSDDWVLIHDINGKLVFHKAFEKGDTVKLEITKELPGNKVNVTFLQYTRINGSDHYIGRSYQDNELNQEWTLKKDKAPVLPVGNMIGNFTVTVNDIPAVSAYQFSDKSLSQIFGSFSWDGGSNKLSGSLPIYQNNEDYLFYMADNQGMPKYKFLKKIKNNDVLNYSFHEMNNFNQIVRITFPPTKVANIFYKVNSVEEGQEDYRIGYLTNCNLSKTWYSDNDIRSEVALGYLDTFSVYNTTLYVGYDSLKYGYEKLGVKPAAITFPLTAKFTLNNRSITGFNYTSNQPFVRRSSSWLHINNTSAPRLLIDWSVEAPAQGEQKFTELPPEFATKYPALSFEKLKHFSSVFWTQGDSFTELINTTFKGKPKSRNYESYTIEVN